MAFSSTNYALNQYALSNLIPSIPSIFFTSIRRGEGPGADGFVIF